ncbi:MAG: glycosyltransferase family 1 protein [Solirubrobacterales bacterium]|nr:glycosyltransferase family 1 protein [Solirubrobacterales bacterium]
MARILAYTSPARGHLYPLTPILDRLEARGNEVAICALSSELDMLRGRGFDAQAIEPGIEAIEIDDWKAGSPRKALGRSVGVFTARAEYDAPDLQRAIAEHDPDLLIVDINSWGAMAAAEASGLPWAVFCPYPLALSSPDVPPFGPGLRPATGPLGRLRDRMLRPLFVGGLEKVMVPGINGVRSGLGLEPVSAIDDAFGAPDLLLYMTAEPFEYQRSDWPDNIVMTGPCEWDPPAEVPAWLERVDQPIVLVTTSSEFQDDGRLAQTALDGLSDEPVFVVATVPAGDPATYRVPGNARVERFVPHAPILDRAVCAVTHGGMGATQKALARGVPVCAVPFGRDQLEVARRVEVAGAGTRLPARRLNPVRLRTAVRTATESAAGARRVAAGYEAAGGASAAADAVEQRLLAHGGLAVS